MSDSLLPLPASLVAAPGAFALTPATAVAADARLANAASWFASTVGAATGLPLLRAESGSISFSYDDTLSPEGYVLSVTAERIDVTASSDGGAFYAAQTVRQLLGPDAFRRAPVRDRAWSVPCGVIADAPRFSWRGCLLDVARHFQPKDAVLRLIDLLAAHKLNVLHLHLTDDQGWRIEIERYPLLTSIGAWRSRSMVGRATPDVFDCRPHGGFYTKDDLREIVAYAAARHITIVPEIDLPGHMQAAIAAYPELGNLEHRLAVWGHWGINENVLNVEDATVEFFRNVLDEVLDVFPSPFVSLGGDEVPTAQWEASPAAQERMRALGLTREAELQTWFLGEVASHVRGRGRRVVVWDEIVESGLPSGAVVQSWRGVSGGIAAVRAGHDVVMCPESEVYFDYRQSESPDEPIPVGTVTTLEAVCAFEPIPPGLTDAEAAHVLGAQAQLWTEHLDSPRAVDYAAFPRLAAFAEAVWTPLAARDPHDLVRRLSGEHLARLDALGVEYRPLAGPHPWQTRPDAEGRPRSEA